MNKILKLAFVALLFLFTVGAGFVLMGTTYRVPFIPTYVQHSVSRGKTFKCSRVPTKCRTNDDCMRVCEESGVMDMECARLDRPPLLEGTYGTPQSVCVPKKPRKVCVMKNGCINVWSGYSSINTMEWGCLPLMPQISGNEGCTAINPNVCSGGKWTYDIMTASTGPGPEHCECAPGMQKIVTTENIPMCVSNCDSRESCEAIYSNSTFID